MTTSSRSRELEGVSAAALRTLLQILCCVFLFLTVLMVEMLIGSDRMFERRKQSRLPWPAARCWQVGAEGTGSAPKRCEQS